MDSSSAAAVHVTFYELQQRRAGCHFPTKCTHRFCLLQETRRPCAVLPATYCHFVVHTLEYNSSYIAHSWATTASPHIAFASKVALQKGGGARAGREEAKTTDSLLRLRLSVDRPPRHNRSPAAHDPGGGGMGKKRRGGGEGVCVCVACDSW